MNTFVMKIKELIEAHMEQAEDVSFEVDGFLLWTANSPTKRITWGKYTVSHIDKYPDGTWTLTLNEEITEDVDPDADYPFTVWEKVAG